MSVKIKNKVFDHIWLKLLALAMSFILWFVVMNFEDSTVTKTINDIPVTMLNTEVIMQHGGVYDITDGETVSIIVKGPRSVVENLEADNFEATADLSHLSVTNSTTINVHTNGSVSMKNTRLITISPLNEYVTLSIEEEVEKSVPVKVITTGAVASGYALGSAASTPNMVTVTGPESVLENIVEARAVVDVSAASKDISSKVRVGCIDGYGAAVEKDNIKLSSSSVKVNIPVYKTKEVPVNIKTAGTPAEGYGVKIINYEPASIVVCGTSDRLKDIKSIEISDIVVTGASSVIEKNLAISEYLPQDIYLANDDTNEIAVNVEIEKLSERELTVSSADISIFGKSSDFSYDIVSPSVVKVKITGFKDDIQDVTVKDLGARINVKDFGAGKHVVVLAFDSDVRYTVAGTYQVDLEVLRGE